LDDSGPGGFVKGHRSQVDGTNSTPEPPMIKIVVGASR
jgi:hypothetical protein